MHKSIILIVVWACSFAPAASAEEIYTQKIDNVGVLSIYVETFNAKDHKLSYCGDYVCAIDGSPFFGSDGNIPRKKISKIVFDFNDIQVNLSTESMYEPGLNKENILDRIRVQHYWGDFYKVLGRFSDGSGGYISQWIVSKHGSVRTHLSNPETLFDLNAAILK